MAFWTVIRTQATLYGPSRSWHRADSVIPVAPKENMVISPGHSPGELLPSDQSLQILKRQNKGVHRRKETLTPSPPRPGRLCPAADPTARGL